MTEGSGCWRLRSELACGEFVEPPNCPRSETDITTGFEPVIGGSNPSEGTVCYFLEDKLSRLLD